MSDDSGDSEQSSDEPDPENEPILEGQLVQNADEDESVFEDQLVQNADDGE